MQYWIVSYNISLNNTSNIELLRDTFGGFGNILYGDFICSHEAKSLPDSFFI